MDDAVIARLKVEAASVKWVTLRSEDMLDVLDALSTARSGGMRIGMGRCEHRCERQAHDYRCKRGEHQMPAKGGDA